jgi:hypothetical protein
MRAVDQNRVGRGQIGFIEVLLGQRHIGAILAIKNQRKSLAITDSEYYQGRQARRVGMHTAHVNALAQQFFANEASHVIGADSRHESYFQSESRRRNRRIGGTAADVLCE